MRPARVVQLAIQEDVSVAGADVFTLQPVTLAAELPCVVVTTAGGYASDERTGLVVTIAVDAYASTPAAAEDLASAARDALLAAHRRHVVRAVRTLSVPTSVPLEGQPADLARCTATYTVSLPIT